METARRDFNLAGVMAIVVTGTALWMTQRVHPGDHATRVLRDYGRVPAFALIDSDSHPMTRESLSGSVWIADFIFTRCAGQCPMMSAQMATVSETFRHVPGVRFVSFTVDPAHDTPEVLAAYAMHYGARSGRWRFVTGEPAAVLALAQQGFHLGVSQGGSTAEPITHSVRFVLVDRAGHIRGYYDATDTQAITQLHADVQQLLRFRS